MLTDADRLDIATGSAPPTDSRVLYLRVLAAGERLDGIGSPQVGVRMFWTPEQNAKWEYGLWRGYMAAYTEWTDAVAREAQIDVE